MKLLKPIEIFFRNLRDSFRYSLKDLHRNAKSRLDDDLLLEHILYAIPNSGIKRPTILNADETRNEIFTTNKNIARFGDGEIMVMNGDDIGFQKADKTLTMRLREIFTNPHSNLMIGINRRYYYPNPMAEIIEQTNEVCKNFELYAVPKMRQILTKYINYDIKYCEASTGKMVGGGGGKLPNVA
ncbi:GT-D fold domain-containing glycosyltransferase [Helicobacter sp. MIT 01-3238]|uniref:GT-D fold domain-containing glycosyltransferase n=1 Tax=Helicobacter sp. MIT 01-3238 TaxID=398627 RepID=UPI000E1EB378|nr:GT-D fold domain-containing glycosyltransferase [Helicobacter sp. MIT 01-3238]RDU51913.1 hypothetical protein CQA40_08735 [Helicobacter sp. MIT 01-3238]